MAEEVVGLRLNLSGRRAAAAGLKDTQGDVKEIGVEAEKAGRRSEKAFALMSRAASRVGLATKVGVAGFGLVGAAAIRAGVKVAASNEQAQISFTTMLGSAKDARGFIGELQQFAADTPFEFAGLQKSASSLLSAGIDAKKIIPIMTSLGNATSGMGTGADGVERATRALQQMTASQRITGEDFNQLMDAGVPVMGILAEATGKTTAELSKMKDKGKLGRVELEALFVALESGKGLERFSGLMDKQSRSLTGQWATFTDTISLGLGKVLDPWMPTMKMALGALTQDSGPLFDRLVDGSERLAEYGPRAVNMIRRAARDAGPYIAQARDHMAGLLDRLRSGQVDTVPLRDLGTAVVTLASAAPALSAQMPTINDGLRVAGTVTSFLAEHVDTLAYLMPVLAAGFVIYKVAQTGANLAAVLQIPLLFGQVVATWSLVGANRALAASNGAATIATTANTAATNMGMLARGRALIGMGVAKVAMIAGAAATGVATVAQWALNAALTANPIGLVVLGVAALVAGVVIAYQKVDWFRAAVDKLFSKMKDLWDLAKRAGGAVARFFGGGDEPPPAGVMARAGTVPARADGGAVTAGKTYKGNEYGPEFFTPAVAGTITPAGPMVEEMEGSLAGSGAPITLQVVLDRKVVAQASVDGIRDQLARR